MPKKQETEIFGWVLLGGKKWYQVYVDEPDQFGRQSLYFLRNNEKQRVNKYQPFYTDAAKRSKEKLHSKTK